MCQWQLLEEWHVHIRIAWATYIMPSLWKIILKLCNACHMLCNAYRSCWQAMSQHVVCCCLWWCITEVFLLSSFVTSSIAADAAASDIAVIRLQRNANFGNAIRPMAIVATAAAQQQQQQPIAASRRMLLASPSTSSSTRSTSVLLTGYPNSEAEGTRVVTKCQLQQQLQEQQQQPSAVMHLGCTTRVGEAGAPLYTAQGVVVGVAAGVQQQQQPSAGVAITPAIWRTLLKPYIM